MGGCEKYNAQQYTNCQCVAEDKVADKRAAVLKKFYKKYNPEKASEAKKLVEKKGGSTSKFAKLMLKVAWTSRSLHAVCMLRAS